MNDATDPRVRLDLRVPRRVAAGAPVPVVISLRNTGTERVELYLRGRDIVFDLEVTHADGVTVWRRLEGEVVQAILRLQVLDPEEMIELHDEWDQRDRHGSFVGPGIYTMSASVLTDGSMSLESPSISFELSGA